MAKEGRITEVVIDESLDLKAIAGHCKMPFDQYEAEVRTACLDFEGFSRDEGEHDALVIFYLRHKRNASDHEGFENRNFQLKISLGNTGKNIVLDFIDKGDGELLTTIDVPFSDLRNGLRMYRRHIEAAQYQLMDARKATFLSRARSFDHDDVVKMIGIVANGVSNEYSIPRAIGRRLVTIVYALFPKSPAQDWVLVPRSPSAPSAEIKLVTKELG